MGQGMRDAVIADLLRSIRVRSSVFARPELRAPWEEGQVFPDTATILGRAAMSFAEFAERNAPIFRGEQAAPRV